MSAIVTTVLARTPLATVASFAHGDGWHGDPEEEAFARPAVIFTTDGRWSFHGRYGGVEADDRVVVLGHAAESYRCAHDSAVPTDRTTYVAIDHERLGYDPLPARPSVPRDARLDALLAALVRAEDALHVDALVLALVLELRDEPPPARRRHAAVAAAQELLDESFADDVTLLDLARAVHLSPYHLHRLFREQVGVPPHEYLMQGRIRRALELLDAGASVTETALAVGFSSPGYFATVFRRRVGVSPSDYTRCRSHTFGSTCRPTPSRTKSGASPSGNT